MIKRLTLFKLKIAIDKSKVAFRKIHILGYMIDEKSIDVSSQKISSFIDLALPDNVAQLQSFLRLANYLREFIPNYSKIVALLKAIKWQTVPLKAIWSNDCT